MDSVRAHSSVVGSNYKSDCGRIATVGLALFQAWKRQNKIKRGDLCSTEGLR